MTIPDGAETSEMGISPERMSHASPGGQAVRPESAVQPVGASGTRYGLRTVEALRRIVRALHLHSRKLAAEYDVTAPQLLCLTTVAQEEPITVTAIALRVHLSSSTVIGILDRLEGKGLVVRERDKKDRRLVNVTATERGRELAARAPSPLQDTLLEGLKGLPASEQSTIAVSLERVVDLMEAKDIAPVPFLDAPVEGKPLPEEKVRDPKNPGVADPTTDASPEDGTNRP